MYTSGAALQLQLHCAFLLCFAEPWVNVKLLQFSQLKRVQWQQRGLVFHITARNSQCTLQNYFKETWVLCIFKAIGACLFNLSAND